MENSLRCFDSGKENGIIDWTLLKLELAFIWKYTVVGLPKWEYKNHINVNARKLV